MYTRLSAVHTPLSAIRHFTHRRHGVSPTEVAEPVDGHGVSPTFCCGQTRCFTHRRHGVSPTRPSRSASNGAGLRNRNARARSLTLKVFNALHCLTPVENSTEQPHTKDHPASWGLRPRRLVRLRRPHPPGIPQGPCPSAFGLTPVVQPPRLRRGDITPLTRLERPRVAGAAAPLSSFAALSRNLDPPGA